MTLRLVHLADLHLDTIVGGRSEAVRARVRAALGTAFERAVGFALDEGVHGLLIAGDAFDDPLLTQATAAQFRGALRALAERGVHVCWATGNHDPGAENVRGRRGRAALLGLDDPTRHGDPRLHVFRSHVPRTVELRDRDGQPVGTVTSIGHRTDADSENLALRLERPPGPAPAVAMLHTQVDGSSVEHARYAPCAARDLLRGGFDYWALGHVHVRGPVHGAPAWYAGNPQGRNAKETGPRGGLLVEIDAGEPPRVIPFDVAPLRFETVRLDSADLARLQYTTQLAGLLHPLCAPFQGSELVLRVELSGPSLLARDLQRPEQRSELEQALALELGALDCELLCSDLTAPRELGDFLATPSALREAHRLLVELEADAESEGAALGDLELSPEAPAPGAPARAGYTHALLAGLADELLARALGELGP